MVACIRHRILLGLLAGTFVACDDDDPREPEWETATDQDEPDIPRSGLAPLFETRLVGTPLPSDGHLEVIFGSVDVSVDAAPSRAHACDCGHTTGACTSDLMWSGDAVDFRILNDDLPLSLAEGTQDPDVYQEVAVYLEQATLHTATGPIPLSACRRIVVPFRHGLELGTDTVTTLDVSIDGPASLRYTDNGWEFTPVVDAFMVSTRTLMPGESHPDMPEPDGFDPQGEGSLPDPGGDDDSGGEEGSDDEDDEGRRGGKEDDEDRGHRGKDRRDDDDDGDPDDDDRDDD